MESFHLTIPALIVESAPPGDRQALAAASLALDAFGMAAAWPIDYPALISNCRERHGADANLWQTCLMVAEVLVDRSRDMLDFEIGISLGDRLGWPTGRTDRLRGEQSRLLQTFTTRVREVPDPRAASCTDLRRELDEIQRTATIGEVAAARARMATTDVTAEELIREGGELRERRAEAARVGQEERAAKARAASTPAASSNPQTTTN